MTLELSSGRAKRNLFSILLFVNAFFFTFLITSSTSFFIKNVGAGKIPLVYIASAIGMALISLFLEWLFERTQKYRYVFFSYIGFSMAILAGCYGLIARGEPFAAYWIFFGFGFLNFMIARMVAWSFTGRYFNFYDSKEYFSFFTAMEQLGIVSASLLLVFPFASQPIEFYVSGVMVALGALALIVLICAFQKHVFCSSRCEPEEGERSSILKGIFNHRIFVLLLFIFMISYVFKSSFDYEFKLGLYEHIADVRQLNQILSIFLICVSAAIIFCSFSIAPWIHRHVMAATSQTLFSVAMLLAVVGMLLFPSWITFIAAEALRKFLHHILFDPSYQAVINTFENKTRVRLKVFIEGVTTPFAIVLVGVVLLACPTTQSLRFFNWILCTVAAFWIFADWLFSKDYFRHHLSNFSSEQSEKKVCSIQALGEFHNLLAIPPLVELLRTAPHKLVRKNIVLSLGKIQSRDVLNTLFEEAQGAHEEIQIAAVQSLSRMNMFLVKNFLVELLRGRSCHSMLVREHTTRVLRDMIGREFLLVLVPHLSDPDPRVVANAIEAMHGVHDPEVLDLLRPFLDSKVARILANTIMVLYRFRETRPRCQKLIDEILRGENEDLKNSIIYAIGKMQFQPYKKVLLRMKDEAADPNRLRNLAFALCAFEENEGYYLFARIFSSQDRTLILQSLHHFLQLKIGVRMRILSEYMSMHGDIPSLLEAFKSSSFDFHEERDYLKSVQPITMS